jgi:L,D-transpeptidase ErfK/SrfK
MSAAQGIRRELQQAAPGELSSDEYLSFGTAMSSAEAMFHLGDYTEAENRYSLAILKGELLRQHLHDEKLKQDPSFSALTPEEALLTPPPQMQNSTESEASVTSPLPPAPQPEQTGDDTGGDNIDNAPVSDRIVGGEGVYVTRKKESLRLVASRLGVSLKDLARINGLKTGVLLDAGEKIRYNNRRIVPKNIRNGILVNIPERSLYLFKDGRLEANFPVAVGMAKKKEKTIWRTPTGRFRIIDKRENPVWTVPISIQKEMEENGEEVKETVPPGPQNPLGKYALKTSLEGILIHSTIRPLSIYTPSSHGCIRVMPDQMEKLFRKVKLSMPGEIIYQPVKVEVTEEGRVFLEVNHDIYEQVRDMSAEVRRQLKKHDAGGKISWDKVRQVLNDRKGVAEDVTLR